MEKKKPTKKTNKPLITAPTLKSKAHANWHDILKAFKSPHVTEKATMEEEHSKYFFRIFPRANKITIKKAFEQLYGKKAIKINIINVKSKKRHKGRIVGHRPGYKKVIITLKKGEKIDLFSQKK